MAEIWTMGELLCEIMRPDIDIPLNQTGVFWGPYPSGAPAIFIDTVAKMGHKAGIIGGVGQDDFGNCLLNRLKEDGVDCSLVHVYEDGTTGVAFVTYFSDGSRRFLYHFADTPATRAIAPSIDKMGEDIKMFHIMGCSLMAKKQFSDEIVKLMKKLKKKGIGISFDPNIRPELMKGEDSKKLIREVMDSCSIFLPGESELLLVSEETSVEQAVSKCFQEYEIDVIAIKRGADGCRIYTRNDEEIILGVYEVDVKDTTGAGDSFDAAFLCGLLEGKSVYDSARLASAAAAINTATFGPMEGEITRENVLKMILEKE